MGEIGIPRREFLYDITFCEADRIIRGYRKRNKLTHQLLAEIVYATTFSMRSAEGTTVVDLFPSLFNDDEDQSPPLTEEECADLQADIDAFNAHLKEKAEE